MEIFPAIDLLEGKCVRLQKGDYQSAHQVAADPFETAQGFITAGCRNIHIVDLDGAKNGVAYRQNREIAVEIKKKLGLFVEYGGGVRTVSDIEELINNGIDRIILGSAALDLKFLDKVISKFGSKISVGIDAKNGYVATAGWTAVSQYSYMDFAVIIVEMGIKNIIVTDIERDGMLAHPNFSMLKQLSERVKIDITASGGVTDITDIIRLREMKLYGAICGKALYSGKLDLAAAMTEAV